MTLNIGIISAGQMGAAVGERMAQSGLIPHTILAGRSQSTKDRAVQAGFKLCESLDELLRQCNVILSIIPPADATSFAHNVAETASMLRTKGANITFVDCNAISPATARTIAAKFRSLETNVKFVDGCILGGPPKTGYSPVFYFSSEGEEAEELLTTLSNSGIIMKPIGGGVGGASAIKMSYASISKGFHALVATSALAAESNGVLPELLLELQNSNPTALKTLTQSSSTLSYKSYRWIAEMREIVSCFDSSNLAEGGEMFEGIAKLFNRANEEKDGEMGDALKEVSRLAVEQVAKSALQ